MGRSPCCAKIGLHRGPWTPREDALLTKYIQAHGEGHWRSLPKQAGLLRCGKSCRLRWMNYLRPDIKRGNITADEDDLIIRLHALLGNRWSLIAGRLPGRTDNEIKNYWNTHLSRRLRTQGTDPNTHSKLSEPFDVVVVPPPHHHQDGNNNNNKKRRNGSSKNNKKKYSNDSNNIIKKQTGGSNKSSSKTTALDDQQQPVENVKKHVVHLPKPIRVTASNHLFPRNESFESTATITTTSAFSDQMGERFGTQVYGEEEEEEVPAAGYSFKDNIGHDDRNEATGFLNGHLDDDHHHLVSGSIFEFQSNVFTGENSLEKLYEEYLQILKTDDDDDHDHDHDDQLQLDSFAESLLI